MNKKGFTLIELLMVMVIIAAVSVVAAPFIFKNAEGVSSAAMARKIREDIRYAQSLALLRSKLDTPGVSDPKFTYRIVFNVNPSSPADQNYNVFLNCPGTNKYAIVNNADNNAFWGEKPNSSGVVESARNPSDGSVFFCVQLGTGHFTGLGVSANFGGSVPGILEFDGKGVPYNNDGAKISSGANTVTVTSGTDSAVLTVTPNTGWVSVQ